MKVTEIALRLAQKIKGVNMEIVKIGALLHDIGRAITDDPFEHFLASAEILKKEGFPEKIVLIAERHFGAGLTKDEAKKLGLPEKDYLPVSLEEKIVCHADNLANGDKERTFEEYLCKLDELAKERADMKWLIERSKERAKRLNSELACLTMLDT